MERDQATLYLLKNNIFSCQDEGTPAMEFYIMDLVTYNASIYDVDCHAHLNTLFGYDIGFDKAMVVTRWLWDPEKNGTGKAINTTDVTHEGKGLLIQCDKEAGLGLSFAKWKSGPVEEYEYYAENA